MSGGGPEWMCLVCMFVTPPPGIGSPEELEVLTVVNGQLVCMRHVPCAHGDRHETLMAGVYCESGGLVLRHDAEELGVGGVQVGCRCHGDLRCGEILTRGYIPICPGPRYPAG